MPIITLCDILAYVGVGQRPLIKDEAVLNAGHVIMCGIYNNNSKEVEVRALCQQTSSLKGPPHSIKIILTFHGTATTPKMWSCSYSCKAGAGGKCKHIVASLLFINRNELEQISCSDVEQVCGKRKHLQTYGDTKALQEFCHVKKTRLINNQIDKNVIGNAVQELLKCKSLIHCNLYSFKKICASKTDLEDAQYKLPINDDASVMKEALKLSFRYPIQVEFPEIQLLYNEMQYFNENIKTNLNVVLDLAVATIDQQGELWKFARQSRITGSRCYSLYTYCNNKHPD
ncbi:hypothetical protein ILUMI_16055 [Ignelater luminosus]|uniref:SWIM-type domain-containing protein n=1 Tax=Ignelater luminosus TaxID=2038154 RepID=A0A8K0CSZ9_IGNLU|nr:hypothetical protein ILUMI_16055 [Ignelater luminosus]